MGLSFVEHKDKEGAAVYMIHDGSSRQERQLEQLKSGLERNGLTHQIFIFSGRAGDGHEIMDFYDLMELPAVLIVRDDDQLYQHWTGMHMPDVGTLSYMIRSVSHG